MGLNKDQEINLKHSKTQLTTRNPNKMQNNKLQWKIKIKPLKTNTVLQNSTLYSKVWLSFLDQPHLILFFKFVKCILRYLNSTKNKNKPVLQSISAIVIVLVIMFYFLFIWNTNNTCCEEPNKRIFSINEQSLDDRAYLRLKICKTIKLNFLRPIFNLTGP